jgi:periplasmic protein TonB
MKRFFVVAAIATFLTGCAPVKHVPIVVEVANLSVTQPIYPPQAVHYRQEGTVMLLVLVGKDGLPKDVGVSQSSGFRILDREAVRTASRWTFRPKTVDGIPVDGYARIPVNFYLNHLEPQSSSGP